MVKMMFHITMIIGCLSNGETYAILALSGNNPLLELLLIAMVNGLLKIFVDSFISFSEILSIFVDFLLYLFLNSCSLSQAEIFGRRPFSVVRFFLYYFLL